MTTFLWLGTILFLSDILHQLATLSRILQSDCLDYEYAKGEMQIVKRAIIDNYLRTDHGPSVDLAGSPIPGCESAQMQAPTGVNLQPLLDANKTLQY